MRELCIVYIGFIDCGLLLKRPANSLDVICLVFYKWLHFNIGVHIFKFRVTLLFLILNLALIL